MRDSCKRVEPTHWAFVPNDVVSAPQQNLHDDWSCLGSANFDKLSFRVNKEMNLSSSAPEFTNQVLHEIFYPDFEEAIDLTAPLHEDWDNTFALIVASQL